MSDAVIRIDGAAELVKKITDVQQLKRVRGAVRAAAKMLKGHITRYPRVWRRPNNALYGNSEKAQRMRRGFFYHLKHGEIDVPYRRGQSPGSKKLGDQWAMRVTGLRGEVGVSTNVVPYARLVQDREKQTGYHYSGGWVTVQGVTEKHGAEAVTIIREALEAELKG